MPYGSLQDLALGVGPGVDPTLGDPTAPPLQPEQFQTSGVQSLLEAIYNGMGNVQLPPARGFGQGFAQGLVGSLGGQGSKIAAARQRFETDQASRRAATDAERRAATTEARKESGAARREADAEAARTRREQADYERDHPIPSAKQLEAAPWLARAVGPDGRISRSVLEGAGKPETGEPLMPIIGPDGKAVLVRKSKAEGKQPASSMLGTPLSGPEADFWRGVLQAGGNVSLGRGGVSSPAAQSIARASIAAGTGQTPVDIGALIPGARAALQAGTANLSNLSKARGVTAAQVSQLDKNSNMLLDLQKKVADTGLPILNSPVRDWIKNLGSSDQAAYETALKAVQTEAARVMAAGYSGGGVVSEQEQKELRAVIGKNFTGRQMQAVLGILNKEGKNRVGSLDEQITLARQAVNAPGSADSRVAPETGYKPGGFFDSNRPGGH